VNLSLLLFSTRIPAVVRRFEDEAMMTPGRKGYTLR
jgi:hypothetical protein